MADKWVFEVVTDWSQPKDAIRDYTSRALSELQRIERQVKAGEISTAAGTAQVREIGRATGASERAAVAAGVTPDITSQLAGTIGVARQSIEALTKPLGSVGSSLKSFDSAVRRGAEEQSRSIDADKRRQEATAAQLIAAADKKAKADADAAEKQNRATKREEARQRARDERDAKAAREAVEDVNKKRAQREKRDQFLSSDPESLRAQASAEAAASTRREVERRQKAENKDVLAAAEADLAEELNDSRQKRIRQNAVLDSPEIQRTLAEEQVYGQRAFERVNAEVARIRQATPREERREIDDAAFSDADDKRRSAALRVAKERELARFNDEIVRNTVEASTSERLRTLAIREATIATVTEAEEKRRAAATVREQVMKERERLAVLTAEARNEMQIQDVKAQTLVAAKRARDAENRAARETIASAIASGEISGGTRFQRAQAALAARTGGAPRLPEEYQKLSQFVGSKALTTVGFALSGALLYGGINAIKEMVTEAARLEAELSLIDSQFQDAGLSAEQFGKFKGDLIDISIESGRAADDIAKVGRSLLGVFRIQQNGQDLGPDVGKVTEQLDIAARFSQITGVETRQVNDDLVAILKSFEGTEDIGFGELANSLVAAENQTGVFSGELLDAAANLAPLASELGFTSKELINFSAAATQASGKGAGALSEGIGRVLTDLRDKRAQVLQFYAKTPELQSEIPALVDAFGAGDTPSVIKNLLTSFPKLSATDRQDFASQIFGRREAQTFISTLKNAQRTLELMERGDSQDSGAFEERWEKHSKTLELSFGRMQRAAEKFGQAIYDAGLGDALKILAGGLIFVVQGATAMLNVFQEVNDLFGGFPAKVLGAALALKGLTAAYRTLAEVSALQGLLAGGARSPLVGLTAAGGLFSPYAKGGAPGPIYGSGLFGGVVPLGNTPGTFKPGLNSGVLGRMAARGGFAGGLAGFASSAGPAIGLAAAFATTQFALEQQKKSEAAAENFSDRASQLSESELKRLIEGGAYRPANIDRVNSLLPGGRDTDQELLEQALRRKQAPRRQGILDAIAGDPDTNEATAYNLSKEAQIAIFGETAKGSAAANIRSKRLQKAVGDVDQFRADFAANPDDKGYVQTFEDLQKFYELMGTPEQQARIQNAVELSDAAEAEKKAAKDASDRLKAMTGQAELAVTKFQAGSGSFSEVVDAYRSRIEQNQLLLRTIDPDTDPELYTQIAQALAQDQEASSQFIDSVYKKFYDNQLKLANISGVDENDAAIEANLRLLAAPDLSVSERAAAAERLIDARQKKLSDSLEDVNSMDEALALINQQIVIEGEARLALIRETLDSLDPETSDRFVRNAKTVGKDPVAFKDEIAAKVGEIADKDLQTAKEMILLQIAKYREILNSLTERSGVTGVIEERLAELESIWDALTAAEGIRGSGASADEAQAALDQAYGEVSGKLNAALALNNSTTRDPVRQAQNAVDTAQQLLEEAKKTDNWDTIVAAQTQLNEAVSQLSDAQGDIGQAALALSAAYAAGDPVASAQIAIQSAQLAVSQANGEAERMQALAQRVSAELALQEAMDDVQRANLELAMAMADGDPIQQAQIALQLAQFNLANAKGDAERIRAQIGVVQAQKALQAAMLDIFDAWNELAVALSEASGNSVAAAEYQLQRIQEHLRVAQAQGNNAEVLRLTADEVRAQAALRDAQLADQENGIQFALQMQQITTGQAIAAYQQLLEIPNLTKQQIQEIQLTIKQLKDQLGQDAQFNIPTELDLPTVYEVNRVAQSSGDYQSSRSGYGAATTNIIDQRVINIDINATNAIEGAQALRVVTDALTAPARTGVRMY